MSSSDKQNAKDKAGIKPGGSPMDAASQEFLLGSVYMGTVTQVDVANNLCTVLTKNPGKELQNVIWTTGGIMAPLLGFIRPSYCRATLQSLQTLSWAIRRATQGNRSEQTRKFTAMGVLEVLFSRLMRSKASSIYQTP